MEAGGIAERLSDIAQGILDDGMIYEQPWAYVLPWAPQGVPTTRSRLWSWPRGPVSTAYRE